ncbi:histidinol-phosphate transaminase [Bacillus salitolerans]|uniref:Histidinol-phosphate aminotransferase n=1 Tax=Bacillus salitolerans TaxID=1437434 RepID=A0ABW4LSU6_9BACI
MVVKIKTKHEVESIAPYVLGKKLEDVQKELGLKSIRKMSENENIYGCSDRVKQSLASHVERLHLYPDGLATDLAEAVSKELNVRPSQLLFGNGSDEVIRILAKAYLNPGDEAIMADVTFPRYRSNVFLEGGKPIIVPLTNGVHDLALMKDAITDCTKMVFVCNPNNPTGTIVGKEALLSFIKEIPSHILVIVDEAYFEYVSTDDYLQTIPLLKEFPNLIILRTFSKIYGLASLRVGFGIMDESIVSELRKVKDVFNVNHIAQVAANAAILDQEHVRKCSQLNQEGRSFLEKEFTRLGLTYFPSQANFFMVDCKVSGDEISQYLMQNGIIVRSGSLLGYPNMIRVTVGTEEDNHYFISLIEKNLIEQGVK